MWPIVGGDHDRVVGRQPRARFDPLMPFAAPPPPVNPDDPGLPRVDWSARPPFGRPSADWSGRVPLGPLPANLPGLDWSGRPLLGRPGADRPPFGRPPFGPTGPPPDRPINLSRDDDAFARWLPFE